MLQPCYFNFKKRVIKINEIKTSNTERLPLTIIDKNWHVLEIEPKLKEIFAEPPILAFKRNKNLKDIIGVTRFLIIKKV